MRTAAYDPIGISDIDAFSAFDAFLAPIFRLPVALDGDDIEIHLRLTAGRINKSQRKITEDTATDGAALRIHGNRLGDLHRTVSIQRDRLIEGE